MRAIRRNSDRLTILADDLLTLSSLESGTFALDPVADVDIGQVVSCARATLAPVVSTRDLDISFTLPSSPLLVHGDAENLERAVMNLLTNAVKFTGDGGWVRCEVACVGDQARVVVSDNGIGIPESEQAELFTRFFRSSTGQQRAIQGSGLGLTIVESIVRGHGGDIAVQSAHLQGTTFTITLPLHAAAPTPQPLHA